MLAYDYAQRKAILEDPAHGELSPHVYILCTKCAEKLRPPKGWELEDRRSEPPLFVDRIAAVVTIPAGSEPSEAPESSRRQLFFGYSA